MDNFTIMDKLTKAGAAKNSEKTTTSYEEKMKLVLEEQARQNLLKDEQKAAKKAKASKPGIIATILSTVVAAGKSPISKDEILDVLELDFGNDLNADNEPKHTRESMGKTVTAQLGVKRPMRIERENKICLDVDYDNDGNRLFGYVE